MSVGNRRFQTPFSCIFWGKEFDGQRDHSEFGERNANRPLVGFVNSFIPDDQGSDGNLLRRRTREVVEVARLAWVSPSSLRTTFVR
ncbi:MAG: hypothetical protein O2960_17640 [Verrucomicrobia bacterium]|nr:hypothetical protein [Verrucomicrobiota bacterium]